MIILGIDPGYAITGWAILEKKGAKLIPLDYGAIETMSGLPHAERLLILHQALQKIIKKFKPELLSVEELFFFKNLKTAIKVAEARGVILAVAAEAGLKILEITPLQIKQALVGYGRAEKKQVQQMVKVILGLKEIPEPDDAADALAAAITGANNRR
ncbi:MAG: crossover junction endodeoxyribonuclease RuvC [Patescibacteria group bacterium]|nr:crossover junction endodeoxyribonuclease RuvC [Patescibacteria group bacterium]